MADLTKDIQNALDYIEAFRALFLLYALLFVGFLVTGSSSPQVCRLAW